MISIFILSFIQGLAEFLPISSSFHLIVFRDIFLVGNNIITSDLELTFDIALHMGTLFGVLFYFKKDFVNMFKEKHNILINLIVATIPAAIVGFLFENFIESIVRKSYILLIMIFIIMGFIIYLVDNYSNNKKTINNMSIKDAMFIGISQVFSLIPGVSRSGMTITASRLLKINREDSTKFSFFLSVPIILGAVVLQLLKIDFNAININYFFIGIIISFLTGLLSIKILLKYVKNNNFKVFMIYRIILGLIVLLHILR